MRQLLSILFVLILSACSDTTPPPSGVELSFSVVDKFDQPSAAFVQGDTLTLRLTIENKADTEQRLQFSTAQLYDFEVTDLDGNRVWLWSDGQVFAQALTELTLSPQQQLDLDTHWDLMVTDQNDGSSALLPVGEYIFHGSFVGYDAPDSIQVSIL
ncbi:MAG: BsuPI-related putative proteinase inhibitor [bacterium]